MAKIVVSEFLTLDGVYQGFDSYRLMVYPVILGTGKSSSGTARRRTSSWSTPTRRMAAC